MLGQEVGGELLYLLLSACGQLPDRPEDPEGDRGPRSTDQHPAVAGGQPFSHQYQHICHGDQDAVNHVCQLSRSGCGLAETK